MYNNHHLAILSVGRSIVGQLVTSIQYQGWIVHSQAQLFAPRISSKFYSRYRSWPDESPRASFPLWIQLLPVTCNWPPDNWYFYVVRCAWFSQKNFLDNRHFCWLTIVQREYQLSCNICRSMGQSNIANFDKKLSLHNVWIRINYKVFCVRDQVDSIFIIPRIVPQSWTLLKGGCCLFIGWQLTNLSFWQPQVSKNNAFKISRTSTLTGCVAAYPGALHQN